MNSGIDKDKKLTHINQESEPLMKDYDQGQVTESSKKTIVFLKKTAEKLPE